MATIREVARAAGVSTATVSRVFSDSPLVSPETARKVLDVARQLDYWPNSAARSLSTRCTRTIGVVLPDLSGEFRSDLMCGFERAAGRGGYQILLSCSRSRGDDVLAVCRAMLGRIDGLILHAAEAGALDIAERIRRSVPVVLLNPRSPDDRFDSVSVADHDGARRATDHLLALGHTEIAFVAGSGAVDVPEERLRGFRESLAAAGVDPDRALVLSGESLETTGPIDVARLLAHLPRPTAVLAAADVTAAALLATLRGAGLHVPADMAVVGFGDSGWAGFLDPALTTVRVDACGMGRQAVEMMLDVLGNRAAAAAEQRVIPATLTIRESCGAVRRAWRPGAG